jgi:hypothetical protein
MRKDEKSFGYRGDRVRSTTSDSINKKIDQDTQQRIQTFATADAESIEARIRELEMEWDIERVLHLNASILAFIGLSLGLRVNKRWFALPLVVLPSLFLHAIHGWCPPIPVLRRIGVRTQREIEAEKYALKALQKRETSHTSAKPTHLSVGMV